MIQAPNAFLEKLFKFLFMNLAADSLLKSTYVAQYKYILFTYTSSICFYCLPIELIELVTYVIYDHRLTHPLTYMNVMHFPISDPIVLILV